MSDNKQVNKSLEDDQVKDIAGGKGKVGYWVVDGCVHTHKTPTNEYREASYFIFWTKRERKWHCNDCEKDVWIRVD